MSDKAQHYAQIERYLRGELNDSDRWSFETAMDADEALREEVRLHRELEETFGDPEYRQFIEVISAADAETKIANEKGKEIRIRRPWRRWMGLAATLLAVVAAGALIWLNLKPAPSPQALFAEYFSPYPIDAFRSGEETGQQLPEALQAYRQGRYAEVDRRIGTLPADSVTAMLTFYRGVALLADGRAHVAATIFEQLLQENALPGLNQPTEWYIALAYLKEGAIEKARIHLEDIAASPDHYRRRAAREMIAALN